MGEKRHVAVTGGGSGIGLAIARAFADQGCDVTVFGRKEAPLKQTGFAYQLADVTDETSFSEALRACGPVDIFVANAGAAETAPALKTSREMWDRMLAVNLTSVYISAREVIPQMTQKGWGRFIAIASTASLKAYPYTGAYAAAKHGVVGWVRTLALELAKTGVTANAVCPGFTDTPMIAKSVDNIVEKTGKSREDAMRAFTRDNPMGRLIATDEIAATCLWLASDGAASINGQTLAIDGGETAS